jgi:hypothetical protein
MTIIVLAMHCVLCILSTAVTQYYYYCVKYWEYVMCSQLCIMI